MRLKPVRPRRSGTKPGKFSPEAAGLEQAGAQAIVLCTNTMHKVAGQIEERCHIPFLHIADATGRAIENAGLSNIALLGTRYTMEQDFYRGRLEKQFGIKTRVPGPEDRERVNEIIFEQLCLGIFTDESRYYF